MLELKFLSKKCVCVINYTLLFSLNDQGYYVSGDHYYHPLVYQGIFINYSGVLGVKGNFLLIFKASEELSSFSAARSLLRY